MRDTYRVYRYLPHLDVWKYVSQFDNRARAAWEVRLLELDGHKAKFNLKIQ